MGTSIGAKEGHANENGTMSSLRSVLKMRIMRIVGSMGVLVFTQSEKNRACVVEENGLYGLYRNSTSVPVESGRKRTKQPVIMLLSAHHICLDTTLPLMPRIKSG